MNLTQLAAQLAEEEERAEQAAQRIAAIKTAIRQHPDVHGPDRYAAGNLTIEVQVNHRFDQKLAEKALPPELFALCSVEKVVRTIDRKRVEVLAPDHLEACLAQYDDKVVLR